MKRTLVVLICMVILLNPTMTSGEFIEGSVESYTPHPDYQFTAQASGDDRWSDTSSETIFLDINATIIPNNISRIYIDAISFVITVQISGVDTGIGGSTLSPQAVLTTTNNTLSVNSTLTAPDEFDRFYIEVGMLVRTDGNTTRDEYTLRFPDSGTIFVQRDDFVPLIDLYGFPPDAFFERFLPIYLIVFAIMGIPGFTFLGVRTIQRIKQTREDTTE